MVLDVVWGIVDTGGTSVKLAIDLDVSQMVEMETHFIKMRVIWG